MQVNNDTIEVKSALWQKLLILSISLLICGTGVVAWLVPFSPVLRTNSRTGLVTPISPTESVLTILMGTGLFTFGFSLAWAVFKYSIRANSEGIRQTNGFFSQSVRWSDVARYYLELNRRYYSERRCHIEPVMLDAEGKIIFQGFAHIFVSTTKIIQKRRELWQFVESQLAGKKSEPDPESDPKVLAQQSMNIDWSKKSPMWKIGRIFALVLYALFWLSLAMVPAYYIAVNDLKVSTPWGYLPTMTMFLGPLLFPLIQLEIRKRKIAKEFKARDMTK